MTGEISPLGHGDEMASPSELRASHEDRDRVVELLRVAAGEGRLTSDELDQRLEQALTARTHGELAELTRDLSAARAPVAAAPQAKDEVRIECHSGSTKRDGRWVVPRRMVVRVASGTVTLDFTNAVITLPALVIDAEVKSGTLLLLTRPGVVVDADDVAIRSGAVRIPAPPDPELPEVLRIIKVRPPRRPRRTFWQWLLRRPRPAALPPP